ncbi:MAG: tol-pal system-associated acyl-CoA thioesterase [Hyphomicrobiales bacterium]|nr:tol-pal system-associated acyl-CoA thioesterase [Hyphomicrobiales bacterium]
MSDSVFASYAHRFPVRVYYEDTDAAGMVYYANYLRFAERARTEMTRMLGVRHAQLLEENGVFFAVRRCEADFVAPARLDDHLEVVSQLLSVGGASLNMKQTIHRDDMELVKLDVRLACMTMAGKPSRIPSRLREMFSQVINSEG